MAASSDFGGLELVGLEPWPYRGFCCKALLGPTGQSSVKVQLLFLGTRSDFKSGPWAFGLWCFGPMGLLLQEAMAGVNAPEEVSQVSGQRLFRWDRATCQNTDLMARV